MTVELLQTLSLTSYVVAGVLLLTGIALFFLFDVPKLYGDVSGRTARKAIEAIRQQNETTGNEAYKHSPVNAARGKLTDKITKSGRLVSSTTDLPVSVGTEKFPTATLEPGSEETVVLPESSNETTVLDGNEFPVAETTVLDGHNSVITDTGVYVQDDYDYVKHDMTENEFSVDVEMTFTESSEIIE